MPSFHLTTNATDDMLPVRAACGYRNKSNPLTCPFLCPLIPPVTLWESPISVPATETALWFYSVFLLKAEQPKRDGTHTVHISLLVLNTSQTFLGPWWWGCLSSPVGCECSFCCWVRILETILPAELEKFVTKVCDSTKMYMRDLAGCFWKGETSNH